LLKIVDWRNKGKGGVVRNDDLVVIHFDCQVCCLDWPWWRGNNVNYVHNQTMRFESEVPRPFRSAFFFKWIKQYYLPLSCVAGSTASDPPTLTARSKPPAHASVPETQGALPIYRGWRLEIHKMGMAWGEKIKYHWWRVRFLVGILSISLAWLYGLSFKRFKSC
jgi:hypothetical protein